MGLSPSPSVDRWHVLWPQEALSTQSTISLLQCFSWDKGIPRWLLTLMGQLVAQLRSCLLPFTTVMSNNVHVSGKHVLGGLTCLMHTPNSARAEPLRPSPSEGNGKIPGECWGLAWIQRFYSLSGLTLLMRQRKHTAHGSETQTYRWQRRQLS